MSSLVELLFVICVWGVLCAIASQVAQRRGRLFAISLFCAAGALVIVLTLIFGESVSATALWVLAVGLIGGGVLVNKFLQRRKLRRLEAEER